ncbi:MAG: hypothetical protein JHD21_05710, partial [Nocardioides sp.]|nr:hypothetical protein [Nocardioides sp.]
GLPDPPIPAGPIDLDEGVEAYPVSPIPGVGRAAPGAPRTMASGFAGSTADQAIINALLAGETGRSAESYGALGSLVYGPVVRGGESS